MSHLLILNEKMPITQKKIEINPKVSKIKINPKEGPKIKVLTKSEMQVTQLTNELLRMKFIGQLFPFQQDILKWSQSISRGILGLDMGLGKTVTMISIICDRNYEKIIIALPLQLLEQWSQEIQKFSNLKKEDICVYQGPKRNMMNFTKHRIILTTYDVIRVDMSDRTSILYQFRDQFDCIVLDEAHKIRNKETKTYESCYALGRYCESKWLLTGTVIHNQFEDFITLAGFLDVPDFNHKVINDQQLLQDWKKRYYYRLTKAQCHLQLPEKSLHEHHLEFDEEHWESYIDIFTEIKQIYADYVSNPTQLNFQCLLSKILRLRQCCNHPDAMLSEKFYRLEKNLHKNSHSAKFKKILEIINTSPIDDKILIFSQWEHSLTVLGKYLKENNVEYLEYNGNINIDTKNIILRKFKETSTKVLLVTLTSGGVGLNLNFANHVIIMDSWWNPALEEQAIDRVYRIGQTKKVDIHRLYMKGTIEEWLIEMKKEKHMIDSQFHEYDLCYTPNKSMLKDLLQMYI